MKPCPIRWTTPTVSIDGFLKQPGNYDKSSAADALGKIETPAKDALPGLNQLYEKEKDLEIKFLFLRAMLKWWKTYKQK